MYLKSVLWIAVSSFLFLSVGCGRAADGLHSFKGTVTHNGKPIQGLLITFTPDDLNTKSAAMGATDENGKFELKVGSLNGVYPGNHKVSCQDPRSLMGGKTSTEKEYVACITKYSSKNSKLTVDVTKDEDNYELKLD